MNVTHKFPKIVLRIKYKLKIYIYIIIQIWKARNVLNLHEIITEYVTSVQNKIIINFLQI